MKKLFLFLTITAGIISGVCLLESCRKIDYRLPPNQTGFVVPAGWPAPVYDFSRNPLTPEGIELGRHLFYEGMLSRTHHQSCGNCHEQRSAFTHEDHSLAHGINSDTYRNPPGIFNMAWYSEFYQDGSIKSLEDVIITHITSPVDMGESMENVLAKLRMEPRYRSMFRAAFGDPEITSDRLTRALAQFVLSMVSYNSKYDKVKRGEASFDVSEQLGYDIFKAKCASCHAEPLFTDFSYRNIGMPLDPFLKDFGRMRVTGNAADSLKFRVLSLRNAALTRPFGHDGRFFSFTNLYMHYNAGVVAGPTTDPLVVGGISLSNFEQGQLTAFLRALTDSSMITDKRFSRPE